jgi:NAD(P)-dependent dehydrogenase (short-subunit alcohol dehydrogenase family)
MGAQSIVMIGGSSARYAQIRPKGSITLFSGILSRRPSAGLTGLVAVNAAVEALGRALAVELAPIRVNVVSRAACRPRTTLSEHDKEYGNDNY